jgi:hypothetical protein
VERLDVSDYCLNTIFNHDGDSVALYFTKRVLLGKRRKHFYHLVLIKYRRQVQFLGLNIAQ